MKLKSESQQIKSFMDLIDVFCEKESEVFRYVKPLNMWLFFDGHIWRENAVDELRWHLADLLKDREFFGNPNTIIKDTIQWLSTKKELHLSLDTLDASPELLNCRNVIINIDTGETASDNEMARNHYITRMADVDYAPDADCPLFKKFIKSLFEKMDERADEAVDYMQKILGYMISGYNYDQSFFFFDGKGGNGKSTLIELLKSIFGTYSFTLSKTLLVSRYSKINLKTFLELRGRRLVNINEFDTRDVINENMFKQLSGNDTLRLECTNETIEWKPTNKFIGVTNNLPKSMDQSRSMLRRFKVVPFPNEFRRPDTEMLEKLKEEKSGILNWLIEGYNKLDKGSPIKMSRLLQDIAYNAIEDTVITGNSVTEKLLLRSRFHVLTVKQVQDTLNYLSRIEMLKVPDIEWQPHVTGKLLKKYAIKTLNFAKYQKIYVGIGFGELNKIYQGGIPMAYSYNTQYQLSDTHIDNQIEYYEACSIKLQEQIDNESSAKDKDSLFKELEESRTYLEALKEYRDEIYD